MYSLGGSHGCQVDGFACRESTGRVRWKSTGRVPLRGSLGKVPRMDSCGWGSLWIGPLEWFRWRLFTGWCPLDVVPLSSNRGGPFYVVP
jgi:hypothetical protein